MAEIIDYTDKEGNIKLWRVFINFIFKRPVLFAIYLALQTIFVLVSYTDKLGFAKAFAIAVALDILWIIIFIGLPALFQLLMALLMLFFAVGVTALLVQVLNIRDILGIILAFVGALVLVGLIFALISIVLYCIPGILIAGAVYAQSGDTTLAIVTFIIVTLIVVAVVYFISKFILPFIAGYGLNWLAVVLANRFAVALVLGVSVVSFSTRSSYTVRDITGLLRTVEPMLSSLTSLPTPLVVWTFFSGIFCGLLNTPLHSIILSVPAPAVIPPASPAIQSPAPYVANSTAPVPPPYSATHITTPTFQPAAQRFCIHCGNSLFPNVRFCGKCGAAVE